MNHIELFAGCGGLCLGLSRAGFKLEFANELSPMAAETFALNILGESLQSRKRNKTKTLWLSSQFDDADFFKRLREDPRDFPAPLSNHCELDEGGKNLHGSLIVGNILMLNQWFKAHPEVLKQFQAKDIDLVSGGPPCQSFSLAGMREKNNSKNTLPWAFANFVDLVKPRCVLLENVTGILRPFTEDGVKYYAWFEVAKAFAKIGYIPLTLHVNAKYAGVAQNRPRFILIALREDTFNELRGTFNSAERKLFESSEKFYLLLKAKKRVQLTDLCVFDLNKNEDSVFQLFEESFLQPLLSRKSEFPSVKDAIGDLSDKRAYPKSEYVNSINSMFAPLVRSQQSLLTGLNKIAVTDRVKRRFRIYQVMSQIDRELAREIRLVISGKAETVSDECWNIVKGKAFLQTTGKMEKFSSKEKFVDLLKEHKTKKQVQRALLPDQPAPAAMSIPDDGCHYQDLRTLTVREMARIQSFPDNFEFRSKVTTGGKSRQFEVPIYTQIGNAVPVMLAYALGRSLKNLLDR